MVLGSCLLICQSFASDLGALRCMSMILIIHWSSGDTMDPYFLQGFPGPICVACNQWGRECPLYVEQKHSDILVHQIKYLQTPVKSEQVDSFIK